MHILKKGLFLLALSLFTVGLGFCDGDFYTHEVSFKNAIDSNPGQLRIVNFSDRVAAVTYNDGMRHPYSIVPYNDGSDTENVEQLVYQYSGASSKEIRISMLKNDVSTNNKKGKENPTSDNFYSTKNGGRYVCSFKFNFNYGHSKEDHRGGVIAIYGPFTKENTPSIKSDDYVYEMIANGDDGFVVHNSDYPVSSNTQVMRCVVSSSQVPITNQTDILAS